MAALNKLAIRGIRSFDDKHVQVIEFYSPLTVIVGHNGSGKTTIIECLKYATTGDLPPNTKGGAFVHDPKMANEKEVKAQVRLRFYNVNRQRMTATRSLQVSMKKTGGLTMKTLEGLLAKTDDDGDGKRNTISTKCSEMDEEVPLLLGVSKAILENVIFCHQEDSNWPLSEPAALKKKFDDIFEATKYTKALDNIKVLRKERANELKVDQERLKFLKADKDKAERMRKELEEEVRKENAKREENENLKERLDEIKATNMRFYQQATSFNTIFERLELLNNRLEMHQKAKTRIKDGMTELKDSTDDLKNQLRNFDAHVKSVEAKYNSKVQNRDSEDQAIEEHRRREGNLLSTQGALVNNKKTYERNVKEREAAISEVARSQNFPGYDYSPLEDHKVDEFMDRLHELVRKADTDYNRLTQEGTRKERELQAELDLLAAAKTSAVVTKKSKQDQITALNSSIRSKQDSFESVSSVDADISVLENDIAVTEGRRDRLDEEIQNARYDEQIRERATLVNQKNANRDQLSADIAILNSHAEQRAKLDLKRSSLESKTAQMDASVASHGARFKELVGSDIVTETMEEQVTVAISRKERELQEAESTSAANNRSLSQIQTQVQIAKQSLRTKKDELTRLETKIAGVLSSEFANKSVEEAIAEAQMEVNLITDEINNAESSLKFYHKVLEMARVKKKCAGCNRPFQENEMDPLQAYINTAIQRVSNSDTNGTKAELKQWQDELDKLRAVQPSVEIAKKVKEREIPDLERQVADHTVKLEAEQAEVETSRQKVQAAKMSTRDLQTLKSAALIISRTLGEVKDLQTDIQRIERDLQSTGTLKTASELQREIDQISSDMKNLQREHQQLMTDKELKVTTLTNLNQDLSRKTIRLSELRNKQNQRRMEEESLKRQQEEVVVLQRELKELDAKAAAAVAPWREKNDSFERYRVERQATEAEARRQMDVFRKSLGQVEGKHEACQRYISDGNERKMRENDAQLGEIRREIVNLQTRRNQVDAEVSELRDQISQAQATHKNIRNNIDYREEIEEMDKVQAEITELDIDAATKARKEFNVEYKNMMAEENDVNSRVQLTSGVLLQMEENRKYKEKTLKTEYKDVEKQFREQLIKTKTSEVANNDLEKYGKALDNAILKYHSIKMDEINDTIGHLWSKTYQGTDIDTLRIVSDHDEKSTAKNKSYNYRVVMVKNDVELDMRGRCSAGQKVLASIIIRLALAESFGQGCGVLALDEPTTNLDQENINALAQSLAEIIRERRRQSNFQLIVITHDEGFLQQLAAHDVLEYYWRVSRDSSQKSTLERQRVGN